VREADHFAVGHEFQRKFFLLRQNQRAFHVQMGRRSVFSPADWSQPLPGAAAKQTDAEFSGLKSTTDSSAADLVALQRQ
jgi:hypothetical protein